MIEPSFLLDRRSLLLGGAGLLAAGSAKSAFACASPAPSLPPRPSAAEIATVHPELRAALEKYLAQPTFAKLDSETLKLSRAALAARPRPHWRPQPQVEEIMVPAPGAAVRVYLVNRPKAGEPPRPLVVHMHGGGYIFSNAADAVPDMQQIAAALGCACATIDYRLAPETIFPGALEDNYASLKFFHDNAEVYGIDRTRIAVFGDSAGGGHAAMLALAARDRGEVKICFQSLIYPMLDDRTGSSRQVRSHIGHFVWTPERNRFGWSSLLGRAAGSKSVPQNAVPARAKNLSGLPPTWIGVGSIDLFVEEDINYARRLLLDRVPVELNIVPGAYHAFYRLAPDASVSKQFNRNFLESLGRGIGLPLPPADA